MSSFESVDAHLVIHERLLNPQFRILFSSSPSPSLRERRRRVGQNDDTVKGKGRGTDHDEGTMLDNLLIERLPRDDHQPGTIRSRLDFDSRLAVDARQDRGVEWLGWGEGRRRGSDEDVSFERVDLRARGGLTRATTRRADKKTYKSVPSFGDRLEDLLAALGEHHVEEPAASERPNGGID